METQLNLDYDGGERRYLLRKAVLPSGEKAKDGSGVDPVVLKGVLRVIDDHGGGREAWLSYSTIASETNCSERQAKRAVEVLERLSLLIVETRRARTGAVCNHYRIVWNEVALLATSKGESPATRTSVAVRSSKQSATTFERSAVAADQSAVEMERSAVDGRPECRVRHTKRFEESKEVPPPPTPSTTEPLALQLAAAAGEWVSKIFKIRDFLERQVAEGKHLPDVLEQLKRFYAIATHPANRAKLHSPGGATLLRISIGAWPADDVDESVVPVEVDQRRRAEEAAELDRMKEERRAMELVREGRRRGLPDDVIATVLQRTGLGAAGDRLGWRGGVSPETKGE